QQHEDTLVAGPPKTFSAAMAEKRAGQLGGLLGLSPNPRQPAHDILGMVGGEARKKGRASEGAIAPGVPASPVPPLLLSARPNLRQASSRGPKFVQWHGAFQRKAAGCVWNDAAGRVVLVSQSCDELRREIAMECRPVWLAIASHSWNKSSSLQPHLSQTNRIM